MDLRVRERARRRAGDRPERPGRGCRGHGALGLLEDIPSKVRSLLGIVVDVNLKSEDGLKYIRIEVEPHPNPISCRGRFHYRSGSSKQALEGAALTRLLLEKHGRTWDDVPLPGVALGDLESRAFAEFRRRGVDSDRLPRSILLESDAAVIDRLQLREGAYLKRAAVLLFRSAPHRLVSEAYVKIGYFRGTDILYQDIVQGDLFSQIDRTMELLYSKYTRALISYDGIYRVETVPVPRDAMREAVTNAVIHRDYASPTSTQIRVYDDRISIGNAARLPPDWTAPSDRAMQSRPHNPQVAHAFFRAGMIEAWGRGIPRITDVCRTAGNPPPTWEMQPGGILRVRFPFSAAYQEADRRVRAGDAAETGTTRTPSATTSNATGKTATQRTTRKTTTKPPEHRQGTTRKPDRQPEARGSDRLLPAAEPVRQPSPDRGVARHHRRQRQAPNREAQAIRCDTSCRAGQGRALGSIGRYGHGTRRWLRRQPRGFAMTPVGDLDAGPVSISEIEVRGVPVRSSARTSSACTWAFTLRRGEFALPRRCVSTTMPSASP